jgi:hypothetical protein
MLDKMVVNILNDATLQLKSFYKDRNNDKTGISFEELLNNNKQIQIDPKPVDNINEKIENKQENNNYSDNAKAESSKTDDAKIAVNAKEITKSGIKPVEKTEVKNSQKNIGKVDSQDIKANKKNDNIKIEFDDPNVIKFIMKNVDIETRQRIENVLNDFNAGRISKTTANNFIAQIINSGQFNNKNVSENRKGIEKSNEKIIDSSQNVNKNKINNENVEVKPIKNDASLAINKQQEKKEITKKISLDEIRNEELNKASVDIKSNNEIKEYKFEINLNLNDARLAKDSSVKFNSQTVRTTLDQNKDLIFSEISKNTRIVLTQGEMKFSTMIRPEDFGRIDMKFMQKDGKLSGKLIVQNQETLNFFKNNVEELRAVMQKSNVELSNLELVLAGSNFNNQSLAGDKHMNNSNIDEFEVFGISGDKDKRIYEENNDMMQSNYIPFYSNKNINIIV